MQQPLVCTGLEEAMSRRSCSITWHSFSPWHNLSKLNSAHGLPKELFLVVYLAEACYTRSVCLSPRSCCSLLFTLQKTCYTHSVCLSPAKRLFIVVNVVFVVFHPQQAHRERARWQGSFRSCGEVPLVGAVGGWPVGSPGASPSPCAQGGVAGSAVFRETVATSRRSAARWAVKPTDPPRGFNRPGCRRPGLRRYPGLRRPWWPS